MSHIGDLLVLFGVLLSLPAGFIIGWWARGRQRKTVA